MMSADHDDDNDDDYNDDYNDDKSYDDSVKLKRTEMDHFRLG